MADAAASAPEAAGGADADAHARRAGSFDRDTAVELLEREPGQDGTEQLTLAAEVSPYWRAGRGPHGGYLAAILVRALIEAVAEPERAPRSLTIHYARAPAPGPVRIRVVHERRGRSLSTLSARMEQDGRLMALVLAAFSIPWRAPELSEVAMPVVAPVDPDRETLALLAEQVERGRAPQFLRQVVVQPRIGGMPFAGGEGPMEIGAWLGVRDAGRRLDAPALALFSDALFSPPFARMIDPATSPTVDLTIHFRAALHGAGALAPGELCFARFRSRLVHEGLFDEDGLIWSARGELLAQSRQLAILMPLGARA